MARAIVGVLTLHLHLPEVYSLKEKRSTIQPLLKRAHQQFNASTAEVGAQDEWQSAEIAFAIVSNSSQHTNQVLQSIMTWVEDSYPNVEILQEEFETL